MLQEIENWLKSELVKAANATMDEVEPDLADMESEETSEAEETEA